MKFWQKTVLIIICLIGIRASVVYYLSQDVSKLGEIKAPVHVNIEIDKNYMRYIAVIATLTEGDTLYQLSPTTVVSNTIQPVVLYTEITGALSTPFIYALFLRVPAETAGEILEAIDGISVFIGNKMFYFTHSDIAGLQGKKQDGYLLYRLPKLRYAKSSLGTPINWYGDFNLAVKTAAAFFIYPQKFILMWIILICLLSLCGVNTLEIYRSIRKQNKVLRELLPLAVIVLAGFLLRFNGYVRYSSWGDELYSACAASNPSRPFLSAFEDPGNPPFYFILLRFWFMVFGWTEQSGRLLSVLLGSAAIVSLYVMVKQFANKKAAFLAAIFMAVSTYLIGFSQEMRGYILEVFLIPIIVCGFLFFVRKQSAANLVWYVIPSVLLVNIHYYGSFFIFGNFLFFIIWSVKTNVFSWKKTALFFAGNIIIVLSLLPFFINTALPHALQDQSFNTWIPKPDWKYLVILFPVLLFIMLRKIIFQKLTSDLSRQLTDYTAFVTAAVLIIAFGFSLYRPILTEKYLVILYPLMVAVIAVVIVHLFTGSSKAAAALCAVLAFGWLINEYETERGGFFHVYQESQAYITADAESHPGIRSVELDALYLADDFYGFKRLPKFDPKGRYDVLFVVPSTENNSSDQIMYRRIADIGIDPEQVVRIRVNKNMSVFKIYP